MVVNWLNFWFIDMDTEEKIAERFEKSLRALLEFYGAELSASNHWKGPYSIDGQDIRITAFIEPLFDKDGKQIRPCVRIDLGDSFK